MQAPAVRIVVWLCLRESPPSSWLEPSDFLFGRMVNASSATYLVDCAVTLCCGPGVLAFATLQDAESFRCGFGGETMSLATAEAYLRRQMANCADHHGGVENWNRRSGTGTGRDPKVQKAGAAPSRLLGVRIDPEPIRRSPANSSGRSSDAAVVHW